MTARQLNMAAEQDIGVRLPLAGTGICSKARRQHVADLRFAKFKDAAVVRRPRGKN